MPASRNWVRLLLFIIVVFALIAGELIVVAEPRVAHAAGPRVVQPDSTYDITLGRGYRFNRSGWTYVHLEGAPHDIGVQNGYLLAPEIADFFSVVRLEMTHDTQRNWDFFRRAAREMLWPKIDGEYEQELQGIADGLNEHGVKLDIWDVVAMNAFAELPDYYVTWLNQQTKAANAPDLPASGHCSAFVATGS